MTCKGICIRHKAQRPVTGARYAIGQKRCQICEMFITWNNLWCPCCGYRLRTKPRNLKKGKKQLSPSVAKVLKMMEAVEAVQAPEEPKTVVELNPDGTITPITATTTT